MDGLFFIEARTVNDYKYGAGEQLGPDEYFYDGHYRRFLRPEQLKNSLLHNGFTLLYAEESSAFSVTQEDAPTLIRIVAQAKRKR